MSGLQPSHGYPRRMQDKAHARKGLVQNSSGRKTGPWLRRFADPITELISFGSKTAALRLLYPQER